jgi:hypothetical protein
MVVALPLQDILDSTEESEVHDVIIGLNLDHVEGREAARKKVTAELEKIAGSQGDTANSCSAWFRAVATVPPQSRSKPDAAPHGPQLRKTVAGSLFA